MITSKLTLLYKRATNVFRTEGLVQLLRSCLLFLAGYFFIYETHYVYRHPLKAKNGTRITLKIKHYTSYIVYTNQQAAELAAIGVDLNSYTTYATRLLDKGAIAFCILSNQELMFIGWAATTEEGKKSLTKIPVQVNFSDNTAYLGRGWSNPKYRKQGLWTYGYSFILNTLDKMGVKTACTTVNTRNSVMRKGINKFANPCGKGRYLKIFWYKCWKEKPF